MRRAGDQKYYRIVLQLLRNCVISYVMQKYFENLVLRQLKNLGHDIDPTMRCRNCGFQFVVNRFQAVIVPNNDVYFTISDGQSSVATSKFAGMKCSEMIVMDIIE